MVSLSQATMYFEMNWHSLFEGLGLEFQKGALQIRFERHLPHVMTCPWKTLSISLGSTVTELF